MTLCSPGHTATYWRRHKAVPPLYPKPHYNSYWNKWTVNTTRTGGHIIKIYASQSQQHFCWKGLVRLSPIKAGLKETKKNPKYNFFRKDHPIEESTKYTYLGRTINNTGNFCTAVNKLRDKAKRFYFLPSKKQWTLFQLESGSKYLNH